MLKLLNLWLASDPHVFSGSTDWTLYLILIAQLLAAVVTISGIAALAGRVMMIAFPWQYDIYAAVHSPVVVFLSLHLNRTRLPKPMRPGNFINIAM